MSKRKLVVPYLIVIALVALIVVSAKCKQFAGTKINAPVDKATVADTVIQMTNQQYWDKLSAINDTLFSFYQTLGRRLATAFKAKPVIWGNMKEYREFVQRYCRTTMVYLSKLPGVGDSEDFAQSLNNVVQAYNHLCDIFKQFESTDENTSYEVMGSIFNNRSGGEKALFNVVTGFAEQKEAYQTKYNLQ